MGFFLPAWKLWVSGDRARVNRSNSLVPRRLGNASPPNPLSAEAILRLVSAATGQHYRDRHSPAISRRMTSSKSAILTAQNYEPERASPLPNNARHHRIGRVGFPCLTWVNAQFRCMALLFC